MQGRHLELELFQEPLQIRGGPRVRHKYNGRWRVGWGIIVLRDFFLSRYQTDLILLLAPFLSLLSGQICFPAFSFGRATS